MTNLWLNLEWPRHQLLHLYIFVMLSQGQDIIGLLPMLAAIHQADACVCRNGMKSGRACLIRAGRNSHGHTQGRRGPCLQRIGSLSPFWKTAPPLLPSVWWAQPWSTSHEVSVALWRAAARVRESAPAQYCQPLQGLFKCVHLQASPPALGQSLMYEVFLGITWRLARICSSTGDHARG